ncbi:hypothetical protein TIFTF001_053855 [Ficus carica]|jgi:hypothetical protein|nr:hypothetical protein TIFTF001_053855 [Ficus carica]
MLQAKL